MAGMNKALHGALDAKYKEFLKAGNFPAVEYKETKTDFGGFVGYNALEYSRVWSRIAKLAGDDLKARGFEDGVFVSNRKNRNRLFLSACDEIAKAITVERINAAIDDRMRTWMD